MLHQVRPRRPLALASDSIKLADGTYSNRGMSLSAYLDSAIQFKQMLTMHHTIEEREIFPKLATRMPQFSTDSEGHVKSHRDIHEGLEKLSSLVEKWRSDPKTYSPTEMRSCLDDFRPVLFQHLDEEVH
ncbi:hypothetical protein F5887DRAFT_963905 [Amanita rubescens]|nr:hypothetical protein F5887DRAFT_963905 [Amanita rubescens]